MGTFSAKERRTYQNICHLSERGVLSIIRDILVACKYDQDKITATPSFVYAFGDIPVALVAHADTVFKVQPKLDEFYYDQERDVIWSPAGAGADDRAGIFAIITILKKFKLKPHVIVTTGEESGCVGAGKLVAHMPKFKEPLKFMIQLDRRNEKDSVFYDCDNQEFEDFINAYGFETEWGTFSDISVLAPVWGVAAVNLSVGYQDEHSVVERLHVDWLYNTIHKVVAILNAVQSQPDIETFKYIPAFGYYPLCHGQTYYKDFLMDDYDYTSGYRYVPKEGYDHCDWCHKEVPVTQILPIRYEHGSCDLNMCLDCHAKCSDKIAWCKQCGKGYYIPSIKLDKIDLLNYICEDCNGRSENSTVQV